MKIFNYTLVHNTFFDLISSIRFAELNDTYSEELGFKLSAYDNIYQHNIKWDKFSKFLNCKGLKFKMDYLLENIDKINLEKTKEIVEYYKENDEVLLYSPFSGLFHNINNNSDTNIIDTVELKKLFFMELFEKDTDIVHDTIVLFEVNDNNKYVVYRDNNRKTFSDLSNKEVEELYFNENKNHYAPYTLLMQSIRL